MNNFDFIREKNHEAVVFCSDKETGLKGIIAIHDTSLGPALGGCRMKSYPSEEAALQDVLKLSRAMTYKASAAGLNLGGGKSVVILEEGQKKTPELLKCFAERIALFGGNYIGAGDVGSDTKDLKIMHDHCQHIVGLAEEDGGLGDSAILTSLGVFQGVRAAVKERLGREDLQGLRIAVQGAGKVGFMLIDYLLDSGCNVVISDPNADAISRIKEHYPAVQVCDSSEIYFQDVDVFSPNAIGGLLTDEIAQKMTAKVIAGGANNPFATESAGKILYDRDILYAPDFVINAGGLIMVACEIEKLSFDQAKGRVEGIYDRTLRVFHYAKEKNLSPWEAARQLAVERIHQSRTQQRKDWDKTHVITATPVPNTTL